MHECDASCLEQPPASCSYTAVVSPTGTPLGGPDHLLPIRSYRTLICLHPRRQCQWCSEDMHLPGRRVGRDGATRGCNTRVVRYPCNGHTSHLVSISHVQVVLDSRGRLTATWRWVVWVLIVLAALGYQTARCISFCRREKASCGSNGWFGL